MGHQSEAHILDPKLAYIEKEKKNIIPIYQRWYSGNDTSFSFLKTGLESDKELYSTNYNELRCSSKCAHVKYP